MKVVTKEEGNLLKGREARTGTCFKISLFALHTYIGSSSIYQKNCCDSHLADGKLKLQVDK
jgi:hypothetical protein